MIFSPFLRFFPAILAGFFCFAVLKRLSFEASVFGLFPVSLPHSSFPAMIFIRLLRLLSDGLLKNFRAFYRRA